jgi:PncC family amidohydrolase
VAPTDDELLDLAARVGAGCRAARLTIATAESCTGGLVAHLLTEVPGSSAYLAGGFVTYANAAKIALVDVPATVLSAHGAVSAQVAVAMAEGARRRLGVDLAVAVTGVAGPDGGTDAKPVGLTYVAIADRDGDAVQRYLWSGDRSGNKRASAAAALALVLDRLTGGNPGTAL